MVSSLQIEHSDDLLKVVVIGAGEPVEELIQLVAEESILEVIGIMDPDPSLKGQKIAGHTVLGWLVDLPSEADAAVIGIPHGKHGFDREALFYLLLQKGLRLPAIASPSALMEDYPLRRGCIILPSAGVASDALLGENCLLGATCRIEPGATVPDHAVVSAGQVIDEQTVAPSRTADSLHAVMAKADEPLEAIIRRINWASMEIILVVDDDKRLIGTVTDGDIRRGILSGVSMEEPVSIVMNHKPISVNEEMGNEQMLSIMRTSSIRHLPVVDSDGRLVRLEQMERLVDDCSAQAVVMAGGLGTRLRPFTDTTPKPLVRVAGRPILDHILSRLRRSGIENVVISVNHMGDQIKRHIGTGRRRDLTVDYVNETKRLGTAGALTLIEPRPEKPFLVLNGDLITGVNYSRLLEFQKKNGYEMVLGVRQHAIQIPYGVVEVCDGCVEELREKPNVESFINAGIYVLTPECVDLIPEDTFFDMTDLVDAVKNRGGRVGVFPIIEYWRDIGRPEDLEAAHQEHIDQVAECSAERDAVPMETIA